MMAIPNDRDKIVLLQAISYKDSGYLDRAIAEIAKYREEVVKNAIKEEHLKLTYGSVALSQ